MKTIFENIPSEILLQKSEILNFIFYQINSGDFIENGLEVMNKLIKNSIKSIRSIRN